MRPPYAYFRTPLYFEFSSALLRPGVNKVEVHLVSVRYAAYMFPFYVGPAQSIEPAYAYANFLQVTLVHAAIVAMLLISLLTLGLFWVRPVETGYPWFAAATLCWAAYNGLLLEPRILIPPAGLWICAAADRARMVLDLLRAVHQSAARLRRPTAADGARASRLRCDRYADRHRASCIGARGFVDPELRVAAGRGAHQRVHRLAAAARCAHADPPSR